MGAAAILQLSEAEYLAYEQTSDIRHEYYRGEMFAMAGASRAHNRVKENLSVEIGQRLKNTPCRSYSSDQRIYIEATQLYTYPDLVITCGQETTAEKDSETLTNPRVIIEVLSPSTEAYDRGQKFAQYRTITTLEEYVLVSVDNKTVEVFTRLKDNTWTLKVATGNESFSLHSLALHIPIDAVFTGLDSSLETDNQ